MRSRHRTIALAVAAAVMLAAAAAASSSTHSTSSAAKKPVSFHLRIGTVLPFTGNLSSVGPSIDASARLAVDTINAALKKDRLSTRISVKVVDSQDDQTSTQPAIEAATKEIKVDKVNVIIGTLSSQSTIAMA